MTVSGGHELWGPVHTSVISSVELTAVTHVTVPHSFTCVQEFASVWVQTSREMDLHCPCVRTSLQRGWRQVCMRSIHLGFPNRKYDATASSPVEMTDVWSGPEDLKTVQLRYFKTPTTKIHIPWRLSDYSVELQSEPAGLSSSLHDSYKKRRNEKCDL
jgi:hypothetical protein